MAEWLKKQAEREAEKEQRRLERLQRKLREPKHQFSDPEYQQQCHDLSERLEDSVIKGPSPRRTAESCDAGPANQSLSISALCFRSAGLLQQPGEGGRHLSNKETELRSERAAAQEEEEEGGGGGVMFLVSLFLSINHMTSS